MKNRLITTDVYSINQPEVFGSYRELDGQDFRIYDNGIERSCGWCHLTTPHCHKQAVFEECKRDYGGTKPTLLGQLEIMNSLRQPSSDVIGDEEAFDIHIHAVFEEDNNLLISQPIISEEYFNLDTNNSANESSTTGTESSLNPTSASQNGTTIKNPLEIITDNFLQNTHKSNQKACGREHWILSSLPASKNKHLQLILNSLETSNPNHETILLEHL